MPIRFLPQHEYVVLAPKERQPYYRAAEKRDKASILCLTLEEMKALWDNEVSSNMLSFLLSKGFSRNKAKAISLAYTSPFFDKHSLLLDDLKPYRADFVNGLKQGWIQRKNLEAASLFIGKEIIISGYFTYGDLISAYLGSFRGDMRIGYELEPNEPNSFSEVEVYSSLENENLAASAKVSVLAALYPSKQPIVCFGFHPKAFLKSNAIFRKNPLLMPNEIGIWVGAKEIHTPRESRFFLEKTWDSLGILTPYRLSKEQEARWIRLLRSGQLASVSISSQDQPNPILVKEGLHLSSRQK